MNHAHVRGKSMNWESEYVQRLVQTALEEDIGAGDATVLATIPARATGKARIVARDDMVCAGLPMAERGSRDFDWRAHGAELSRAALRNRYDGAVLYGKNCRNARKGSRHAKNYARIA